MVNAEEGQGVEDVQAKGDIDKGARLEAMAREFDLLDVAEGDGGKPGVPPEQALQAELSAALQGARDLVLPMAEIVINPAKIQMIAGVWGDQQLERIAKAGAKLMILYGWTFDQTMSKLGPWFGLAGSLAGPLIITKKILDAPEKPAEGAPGGQQQPA